MTQMNKTKIVKNEQNSAYLTLCMLGNFAFFFRLLDLTGESQQNVKQLRL